MQTQTYRAPKALSRWQRFLYFFFAKLGLTTWDAEQSRWFWYRLGLTEGKKSQAPPIYGPCCAFHGPDHMVCTRCKSPAPQWFPDYEPVTEPRQKLQVVIPTQRPNQVYLQARREGKGEHTAALEAIPKWLVNLREKPKEGK